LSNLSASGNFLFGSFKAFRKFCLDRSSCVYSIRDRTPDCIGDTVRISTTISNDIRTVSASDAEVSDTSSLSILLDFTHEDDLDFLEGLTGELLIS
jgi:hypothetical protein